MPSGDEGTGLHAFDDLDPISTVSALNVAPDDSGERPGAAGGVPRSAPPPPPGRRFPTLPHVSGGGVSRSTEARSTPPPPPFSPASSFLPSPRAGASRSVPPPPPRPSRRPDSVSPQAPPVLARDNGAYGPSADNDEEATRIAGHAFAHDPRFAPSAGIAHSTHQPGAGQFEEFGSSDDESAAAQMRMRRGGPGGDDSELLERSATSVATNIDMDWDEEDVKTKVRDEDRDDPASGAHAPFVAGRPSPFPPPMPLPYNGNPSPFSPPSSEFGSQSQPNGWESEDEARTRVMSGHTLPSPSSLPASWNWGGDSLSPATNEATVSGEEFGVQRSRMKPVWIGLAAAAVIGVAVGTRTLVTGAEPATVTIVTKPSDAELIVDGAPHSREQTSPFTVQGLTPEAEHTIVVRKPGFAEQVHHLRLEPGEVKALSSVELAPLRVDTGFVLSSVPEGAEIFVDDEKLAATTPARITDLKPGLHVIRLVRSDGYQPWETQVALASGQVIELPTARLVAGSSAPRPDPILEAPTAQRSSASASPRRERSRTRERRERAERPVMAPAPTAAPRAAAEPRSIGNQGILRINSRPWSQVYVDGRIVGNTPQMNIPLAPGSHKIKLVNPQLGMSKNVKVRIQSGETTTKIVELME
jgi:hypothetical protein